MEINITWNVCRICLQEQNAKASANADKDSLQINADTAKQIFDMTGVEIKTNDLLPQKICRKCSQVLKQAVRFRTTCRSSNTYLQNILEKAKSTTSLFKLDKPSKVVFEDLGEEPPEDSFSSDEQISEDFEKNEPKRRQAECTAKSKEQSSIHSSEVDKGAIDADEHNVEKKVTDVADKHLLAKTHEEYNKSNVDFGSLFLCGESDGELSNAKEPTFSGAKELKDKTTDSSKKRVENSNFLQYKTLEVTLDSSDDETQDEMLQSSNLSTVDLTNNDGNQELFFIFSHEDVLPKSGENDVSNDAKNDNDASILVENMADMNDDYDGSLNDEDDYDEIVGSENNALDQIEGINEENSKFDDTAQVLIKGENISRSTTPNNEIEGYYQQDDTFERTLVHMNDEDSYVMLRPAHSKHVNFFCEVCGNQFNSRSLLKHHMRLHRNERNYECEMCHKRFTAACNLTTHMRTHTGEKPYVCHFCHRRFSDKSTHVKHERSHTGERPYSCNICHKAFTLSSSLKAHEKVHSGEKPYSCYTCAKSFKLPHQLKAHLSTNSHKIQMQIDQEKS